MRNGGGNRKGRKEGGTMQWDVSIRTQSTSWDSKLAWPGIGMEARGKESEIPGTSRGSCDVTESHFLLYKM